jgi:hypothetical protein
MTENVDSDHSSAKRIVITPEATDHNPDNALVCKGQPLQSVIKLIGSMLSSEVLGRIHLADGSGLGWQPATSRDQRLFDMRTRLPLPWRSRSFTIADCPHRPVQQF